MTKEHQSLVQQSEKLMVKWHRLRWVYVFFSILLTIMAFFQNTSVLSFLFQYYTLPSHISAILAGGLIAYIIKNWNGSEEQVLLQKFCVLLEKKREVSDTHVSG